MTLIDLRNEAKRLAEAGHSIDAIVQALDCHRMTAVMAYSTARRRELQAVTTAGEIMRGESTRPNPRGM